MVNTGPGRQPRVEHTQPVSRHRRDFKFPWLGLRRCLLICPQLGVLLLLFNSAAQYAYAQAAQPDAPAITRALKDASRALQARNAARFLSYFDRKRSAVYPEIESSVVALTRQADIASSIEVSAFTQEAGEYLATADWILQLTLIGAPGQVTTRHENVHLRMAKSKGRWKIIELDPAGFLRPL